MARAKARRWQLGGVLTALCALLACAQPAMAQSVGAGVRLGVSAAGTRVVIDSADEVSARPAPAQSGRLEFTFSGLYVPQPLHGPGRGVVKAWWLAAAEDGARLTLEMDQTAGPIRQFIIPPGQGAAGYRYVIDLADPAASAVNQPPVRVAIAPLVPQRRHETIQTAPVSRTTTDLSSFAGEASFALAPPPAAERAAAPARTRLARTRASLVRQVVVIDAGHGGHDPGAQSADANEKDITLAAALELRARLERDGRYSVVMTRSSDVFVPLEERVRIARRAGADLFIALHADSAGADPKAHGASVYTLSDHGQTRVSEVLDGHEWFRHATASNDPAVGGILLDLTQRTTRNRSSAFAQLLIDRLSDKIDLLPNSHRDAGYFVLLAPDVPAVLLEMGFISCPGDEARLTDPAQRRQLVAAVADAIDAYFAGEVHLAAN
jgi:N-acetylmuramoyl-L-alanine amidase